MPVADPTERAILLGDVPAPLPLEREHKKNSEATLPVFQGVRSNESPDNRRRRP
jgi:hypothetical protein